MIKPRLIVCLLLKGGLVVRSELFKIHQAIGNPIDTVHRLSNWNVDELIILDIGKEAIQDMRRDDLRVKFKGISFPSLLSQISEVCMMPLSVGGKIKDLKDISDRLNAGADKVIINTEAYENPDLIKEASEIYGSQCIVVSIDVKVNNQNKYEVYVNGGTLNTNLCPLEHAKHMESLGAGEIFLNCIDRDGIASGYDNNICNKLSKVLNIPIIICGGVGKFDHFSDGITKGKANAVAAANIFHFFEQSYVRAKQSCVENGINMRPSQISSKWFNREPQFKPRENLNKYKDRIVLSKTKPPKNSQTSDQKVRWCKKCLYPWISATPMEFDNQGICMGCLQSGEAEKISNKLWEQRKKYLIELIEKNRCKNHSKHDCIIPVSGGKDSYFQAHFIRNELGFNPLLVTYYGNNFTKVGNRNLFNMKDKLGLDHIIYYPNVETLKKLNRLGFILLGDMNWHNHVGIATLPMKVAVEKQIPLVIWGEHGYANLCGQYSINDFVEWTYRNRVEHFARGFDWNFFVGLENLKSSDLEFWKYPSDKDIYNLNLRGIYLSNYTLWEANSHAKLVAEKYGFESSDINFERTYRKMSNLDDMHENGIHDYLRYIKFGYGRCTDHASKDIRANIITRKQGIDLVKKHDHVKSNDLKRWLEYVGMKENEFDLIADTWRDRRVWKRKNNKWTKKNVWDV